MRVKFYIIYKNTSEVVSISDLTPASIYSFFDTYNQAEKWLEDNTIKKDDYLIVPVIGE